MFTLLLILAILSVFSIAEKQSCDQEDYIEKVAKWTRTLPILVQQDEQRLKNLADFEPIDDPSLLRNEYYRIVSETQQTPCNVLKRIGGRWIKECGFLDGEKIVCMDNLYYDVKGGKCLIYSFGLADDWDFEVRMAKLGCQVHAYDPNVEMPNKYKKLGLKNLHFHQIGLGGSIGSMKNGAADGKVRQIPVLTLEEAIKRNGDEGKIVTYLKLDVEGAEFYALPQISKSGVLQNIQQIGIEMHTGNRNLQNTKMVKKHLNSSLTVFKEMQEKYGFRLIAYNANGCMGKKYCMTRSYHNYHDLVFYKPID